MDEASGDLTLGHAGQDVRLQKPVAYQVVEGRRVSVEARYALEAGGRVSLAIGGYDAGRPLVIDPVLVYSTYLGGSGGDAGQGIAVDLAGNAYVTGFTDSASFPTAHPRPQAPPSTGLRRPLWRNSRASRSLPGDHTAQTVIWVECRLRGMSAPEDVAYLRQKALLTGSAAPSANPTRRGGCLFGWAYGRDASGGLDRGERLPRVNPTAI
ncbi:MAG: SBBP repeat-containing protein [Verrucomicrobia bacterium]|nr:SBBP repeat-containing protein [Verrucomicrobiota bacterium]